MQQFHDKRKSARKVEDFGVNPVLASYDHKEALRSMYKQEFIFCEKVKERLRSSDDYQAFLKCLHIHSTEIITKKIYKVWYVVLFLIKTSFANGFLAGAMNKSV
ncbi:Paired amphipathic helix protein Sin3-like 2 [Camellia lanceoleosa]|uniref:Paired amphipathic helix protein Sin3-like 2 n=1 Tax=Camellia lanceoleosa TaxID=1840588 RepID=A0ACC0H0X8_9ERIC|nr:Paired amphipathic helix protein Sin3-like 2 [Camellia lanceoleosa]